jgi:hypothetical protein
MTGVERFSPEYPWARGPPGGMKVPTLVTPAQAEVHVQEELDSRFRGNDEPGSDSQERPLRLGAGESDAAGPDLPFALSALAPREHPGINACGPLGLNRLGLVGGTSLTVHLLLAVEAKLYYLAGNLRHNLEGYSW